jgi:hypothetical protein
MPAPGVVEVLAPRHRATTTWRAWALVVKWCRDTTSCSSVEKNASAGALSKPTLPIDWDTASFRHSVVKFVAV